MKKYGDSKEGTWKDYRTKEEVQEYFEEVGEKVCDHLKILNKGNFKSKVFFHTVKDALEEAIDHDLDKPKA